MEPKEIEIIKKLVEFLEVARKSNHVTYHAMVDSENLKEMLKAVKKITQWSEEDEKRVIELAEKFKKETEGKTLKEKSDKLKNIMKTGWRTVLISAIAGGIGFATYRLLKTNGAKK